MIRISSLFPACAGVFPGLFLKRLMMLSIPRARGGVSCRTRRFEVDCNYSPHKRGCFSHAWRFCATCTLFPACVGVFLRSFEGVNYIYSPQGGVSYTFTLSEARRTNSPLVRGCFSARDFSLFLRITNDNQI